MAYLRRVPRSPFWIAGFDLPYGRRTQRSTKMTDRRKAMKLAEEWEQAARNRITENQARSVLSDIHEIVHGSKLESPAVSDYIAQWLGRKSGETSPVTILAYRGACRDFEAFLGEKAKSPLHYVTPAQIATWRDKTAARATPRTANNLLKIIRTVFQSAWRDGFISDNPAAKVSALRSAESVRRPFTLPELKRLVATATGEWRGMILAGLYTGQRLRDIARLTWANVDLERGDIVLSTSKTGRRQILPIAPPLRVHIEGIPSSDNPTAPLFPNAHPHGIRPGGSAKLSQEFHGILEAAGFVPPRLSKDKSKGIGRAAPREKNPLSFHSLRHTATSLLKNAGVSEAVARDIVGHDSEAVSNNYTHVDEASKRDAIGRLPDIT